MDSELRALFPNSTQEELRFAKERLEDYLAFVARIYDRIRANPDEYARYKQLIKGHNL